jgi:AcrR family transcriptional regulator
MTTADDVKRKTKFDLKREATYAQLVEAGMVVFSEKGFAAARVDDIVERTGQTKGAFYFHFKNKLDLLHHIVAHREQLRADWQHLPETMDAATPLADVIATTLAEIDRRLHNVGAWVLVMVDAHLQSRGDASAEAMFASTYERWIQELTEFVDVLQRRGWATSPRPARELAVELFALGEGIGAHARLYGAPAAAAIPAYVRLLTS